MVASSWQDLAQTHEQGCWVQCLWGSDASLEGEMGLLQPKQGIGHTADGVSGHNG